jgi:hypothetical protein
MVNYGQPKIFWAKMLPTSNKNPAVAKIATKVAINLTVCILVTNSLNAILPITSYESIVILIEVIES